MQQDKLNPLEPTQQSFTEKKPSAKRTSSHASLVSFLQITLLFAIELIVCFTPLGTLPIGSISATLSHIPVIIAAILLGEKVGAFMGLTFGMCSLIVMTFVSPGISSFIFTPFYKAGPFQGDFRSLIICFIPRILIGPMVVWTKKLLTKLSVPDTVSSLIGGFAGSLTNTALVLIGITVFFSEQYLQITDSVGQAISAILWLTVVTNGIPEAILGAFAGAFIANPVKKAISKIK